MDTVRVTDLLSLLCSSTKPLAFVHALWTVLLSLPSLRLPALNYVLSQLHTSKKDSDVCKAIRQLDNPNLAVSEVFSIMFLSSGCRY